MKPIITLSHSDEVSGLTIFDDGTKAYWSEGPGVEINLICANGDREIGFEDSPYAVEMEHGIDGRHRAMTAWEELEFEAVRNEWDDRDARRMVDAMHHERRPR